MVPSITTCDVLDWSTRPCHDAIEDAEHYFFVCPTIRYRKDQVQQQLRTEIRVENIIEVMTKSSKSCRYIANYVKHVVFGVLA